MWFNTHIGLLSSDESLTCQTRSEDAISRYSVRNRFTDAEVFSLRIHSGSLSFGAASLRNCFAEAHEEAFGTAGRGSPANRFLTRPAKKSANGPMSSPTLALSRASI